MLPSTTVKLEEQVHVVAEGWSAWERVKELAESHRQEDAFYVLDIGDIVNKFRNWKDKMPRVEPHYAVKCNTMKVVLEVLAALGAGFDCASKAEIDYILDLGVSPDRIIFANPQKPAEHVRHALLSGVNFMTFDCDLELLKIKQNHPLAKLVIRIRCDAKISECSLGDKFGCEPEHEAPQLMAQARALGLDVVGVSFHVGTGCGEPEVFSRAIAQAADLFRFGNKLGHSMDLLDIGGGYPGETGSSIDEIAAVVNSSLDKHFPVGCGVRVISEPGRYFVSSAFTMACCVYAKRQLYTTEGNVSHTMYFLNDGVYGSFNRLLYNHKFAPATPLKCSNGKPIPSSLWGPTCTSIDQIVASVDMPPMEVGDWVAFRDMGAYTLAMASTFNGFPIPQVTAYVTADLWAALCQLSPLSDRHFVGEALVNMGDFHSLSAYFSPTKHFPITFN